ncbi:MAG TPA: DUF4351 domain-containing protein [Allocoleopsis sp.]
MTTRETIDHDRLFKEVIGIFFNEFISLFFPDIMSKLNPNSLILMEKEIFTDVTSGEKYEVDLLANYRLKRQKQRCLIHVEHQSSPDSNINLREFRYFSLLHQKHLLPIYPIVIFSYSAPKRAESNNYEIDFLGERIMNFNYKVIQLNRLNWRDFLGINNPIACAFMAKMQMEVSERPLVKLECLKMLSSLGLDVAKTQLISGFIDIYLRLNPEEEEIFQVGLREILPPQKEEIMQIVTSWMEKGIEQEALSFVQRLIRRKIGVISSDLEIRINQLSIAQLEELGESLFDITNQDDLISWLNTHI